MDDSKIQDSHGARFTVPDSQTMVQSFQICAVSLRLWETHYDSGHFV